MKSNKFINMILASVLAALIFLITRFVQIPVIVGYINLGDAVIYLAAALLPAPYAMTAAGLGGALADITAGYAVYAPITVAVKILLTLCFSNKNEKILTRRNTVAPFVCCLITVAGYFLFDVFYYDSGAVAALLPNFIQSAVSAVIFFLLAAYFDRINIKLHIFKQ